jgi:peroxiredoxin Q/BCP
MTNASRAFSMLPVIASLLVPFVGAAANLAVGDAAPAFEMKGSDGKIYKLADLLGQGGSQGVVLSWFPMAFTSG